MNHLAIPRWQFFGNDGKPLAFGRLYTYAAGTDTPLSTYSDHTGIFENLNPVRLNERGEAEIWCADAAYKFVLKDSLDSTIWSSDYHSANLPVITTGQQGLPCGVNAAETGYQVLNTQRVKIGADVASAAVLTLGEGNIFTVTGVAAIFAIGPKKAGTFITLRFTGAATLAHNAVGLILPGAADIVTKAGDVAQLYAYADDLFVLTSYLKNDVSGIVSQIFTSPIFNIGVSGTAIDTAVTTSTTKIPHSRAVKTYADNAAAHPTAGATNAGAVTLTTSPQLLLASTVTAGIYNFGITIFGDAVTAAAETLILAVKNNGADILYVNGMSIASGASGNVSTSYTINAQTITISLGLFIEVTDLSGSTVIELYASSICASTHTTIGANKANLFHFKVK